MIRRSSIRRRMTSCSSSEHVEIGVRSPEMIRRMMSYSIEVKAITSFRHDYSKDHKKGQQKGG